MKWERMLFFHHQLVSIHLNVARLIFLQTLLPPPRPNFKIKQNKSYYVYHDRVKAHMVLMKYYFVDKVQYNVKFRFQISEDLFLDFFRTKMLIWTISRREWHEEEK